VCASTEIGRREKAFNRKSRKEEPRRKHSHGEHGKSERIRFSAGKLFIAEGGAEHIVDVSEKLAEPGRSESVAVICGEQA
jgi:hypothetical protein